MTTWSERYATSVEDLLALLAAGAEHLEAPPLPFTLLEHSLQTAAVLAERHPEDLELQAAGLLHDVGHTLLPDEPALHAEIAGTYLRPLCGERVAEAVRLHVEAKRYLVATEPGYRAKLSMGSAETLVEQGEAMTAEEAAAFAARAHAEDALELRRADESGKVIGRAVPPLEAWASTLRAVCERRAST